MKDQKKEEAVAVEEEVTENSVNEIQLEMGGEIATGSFRTFFIFLDLPFHFEFRVSNAPLFNVGSSFHVKLNLRNPKDPKRIRKMDGAYLVKNRKIVYSNEIPSKQGWSQYLSLAPLPT
jgi:hypothetical protein